MGRRVKLVLVCVMVASFAIMSKGTMEDDEKECAEQLTNLASCIPFVSGTAKKPTQECCEGTQKVKSSKPKCLCVLIKESTDPSMGLPINTTLALQMPSACNIDAKVSDCPTLLKVPADSPDAKIFKGANGGDASATTSTSTNTPPIATSASSSGGSSSTSSTSGSGSDSKATHSSNNGGKSSFGSESVVLVVMISAAWMFT